MHPPMMTYIPAMQVEQAIAPAEAYSPTEHAEHTEESEAPTVVEYIPTAHLTQLGLPVLDWKRPAEHVVHSVELSVGANVPIEQLEHDAWPVPA